MPDDKPSWIKLLYYRLTTRRSAANLMMLSFIILTSIGAGLFMLPLGLIVAGVACGVFGFLLGLE